MVLQQVTCATAKSSLDTPGDASVREFKFELHVFLSFVDKICKHDEKLSFKGMRPIR